MPKKYPKGVVPPCPGESHHFTLVDRDGYLYWRRKRGTVVPVKLNEAMQQRQEALKALSGFISRLRTELIHYMRPLPSSHLYNDLFKWLQQSYIDNGRIDFSGMKDKSLHRMYTLSKIFKGIYRVHNSNHRIALHIAACSYALNQQGTLVTEFAMEAMLLHTVDDKMTVVKEQSPLYAAKDGITSPHSFEFELPMQGPWMLLLKLICFEDKQWAIHPKHYGMEVVEVGLIMNDE